ncbi:EF-P lysine aminoacylase EpmA [Elongatibacter sediminis]|uniref:EF-P lysine aminoacylase EpmA n=1 Tax=Elongatibacter sediminis TaxID=3119006 RepID=A0AAW9RK28_9GAMM
MSTTRDSWRPSASRHALEARAEMLSDIRTFFAERNVLEVETPVLSRAGNTDPNITGLRVDGSVPLYLRTSPEYPMKRLVASFGKDIYELGRVFRGRERGGRHNPEFTMAEWYRVGWNWRALADEVVALIRHCGRGEFDRWPCEMTTYRDLFLQHLGLDPFTATESDCEDLAGERGITAGPMDVRDWLDLLLSHVIQPAIEGARITVVCDFPVDQAALATLRDDDPPVAERFEVYLGGMELANGYQELGDARELRDRFEHDNRIRELRGDPVLPIDDQLIAALDHGLPDCAGVALGVDRLLMARLGVRDIGMTLSFPSDRA